MALFSIASSTTWCLDQVLSVTLLLLAYGYDPFSSLFSLTLSSSCSCSSLLLLALVDVCLMIVTLIAYLLMLAISVCPCVSHIFDYYEKCQNVIFNKLFGMSFMESKGFRS